MTFLPQHPVKAEVVIATRQFDPPADFALWDETQLFESATGPVGETGDAITGEPRQFQLNKDVIEHLSQQRGADPMALIFRQNRRMKQHIKARLKVAERHLADNFIFCIAHHKTLSGLHGARELIEKQITSERLRYPENLEKPPIMLFFKGNQFH